jgi:hypothetical protein
MEKGYIFLIIILVLILIVLSYFIYNKVHLKNLQKDCEVKGGIWAYGGSPLLKKGFYYCDIPVKDEGKWCNDSEQCESGYCAVPGQFIGSELYNVSSGTCYSRHAGSGYYMEDGRVLWTEVD